MAMQQSIKIQGRLVNTSKIVLANLRIEAWDKDLLVDDFLSESTTNAKGEFNLIFDSLRFKELFLDKKPDVYFKIYQGQKLIKSTIDSVICNLALDISNIEIVLDIAATEPPDAVPPVDFPFPNKNAYKVSGIVTNALKEALPNQTVYLVDIDLQSAAIYKTATSGKELEKAGIELLGQATTADDGSYSITFTAEKFAKQERGMPDVVAMVVEKDLIIGRSTLSNKKAWNKNLELNNLNVSLMQTAQRGISEYATVMQAIMPLVEGAKLQLHQLSDSEDQKSFLAEESEQNPIYVSLLVESAQITMDFHNDNLPHELLYGIARQQISLYMPSLALMKIATFQEAIKKSIQENIIGHYDEKNIQEFVQKIISLAQRVILNQPIDEKVKDFQKLLSISLPDKKLQAAYLTAHQQYDGEPEKFWKEYLPNQEAFKGNEKAIQGLLFGNQLSVLTQSHYPLIETLRVGMGITEPKQLLKLDTTQWTAIIEKTGMPADANYSKEEYAASMQGIIDASFPTQRIAIMNERNAFNMDKSTHAGVIAFFEKALDFDISKSNVDTYDTIVNAIDKEQSTAIKSEIKILQRLYQVSPVASTLEKLKAANFISAAQINAIPQTTFIKTMSGSIGEENAYQVYERAQFISNRAKQIAVTLHKEVLSPMPAILRSGGVLAAVKSAIPNFEELFGTTSICECDHCRSVYSPAAYLVDILRFLDKSDRDPQSPYDVLLSRRPDLAHLKLTCENTNTIIPYIDLVNEVLEYYVAFSGVAGLPGYDTGPTSAAELRAEPQNFQKYAYNILSNAVYPFSLPYHQPLDVIRTHFNQINISRFDLMTLFKKDENTATKNQIAAEYFSINEKTFQIITKQNFDGTSTSIERLNTYFGYADEITFKSDIKKIPVLLRKTGLKYVDVVALLTTKFLNPRVDATTTVTLFEPTSKCDLNTTELRSIESITTGLPELSDTFLDRFHRFIRLWRNTSWTIRQLDQLVSATGEADINEKVIQKLSKAAQVAKLTSISIDRLHTLWGQMDFGDSKSTYHRLFLSKANRSIDPVFITLTNTDEIKDHSPYLLGTFGISESDLLSIKENSGLNDASVLNLENITNIYRYVLLAKSLKLSIADFILIKSLVHINPFDKSDFNNTLLFLEKASKIKASGCSLPLLSFLFNDIDLSSKPFGYTTTEVEKMANTILLNLPEPATLLDFAQKVKAEKELIALISTAISLDAAITETLIELPFNLVENPAILQEELPKLKKASLIINTLKLEPEEVIYIFNNKIDFDEITFKTITLLQWERLVDYTRLRNHTGIGKASLLAIFTAAKSAAPLEDLKASIVIRLGWSKENLEGLFTHFNHDRSAFNNEKAISLYLSIIETSTKSGLNISSLIKFSIVPSDFTLWTKLAGDAIQTVKAKYEESSWLATSAKINDQLRENQKLALISSLINNQTLIDHGVKDADGLFEFFLIDVQMDACMDTSRIKQAISSVQLFIQRCFLNLENEVSPDQIEKNRWSWMKNYRVWEANRKIFLYPENWLEPEWRDDKTPFFKDLESELLQNDITDASVETAFRNYLSKLDSVSNLDLVGIHQQNSEDATSYRLHLVGRTHAQPYIYYYRTYESAFDVWSSWQKIPVDIKGVEDGENSGVHLMPIVWKGRLFLFWPEFFQKVKTSAAALSQTAEESSEQPFNQNEPLKYWEIKLCWTELKDGKWTPKQMSKEALRPGFIGRTDASFFEQLKSYKFKISVVQETNAIVISLHRSFELYHQGSFISTDINNGFKLEYSDNLFEGLQILVSGLVLLGYSNLILNHEQSFSSMHKNSVFAKKILNSSQSIYLNNNTDYNVLYNQNDVEFWGQNASPFFFNSTNKSYFALPFENVNSVDKFSRPWLKEMEYQFIVDPITPRLLTTNSTDLKPKIPITSFQEKVKPKNSKAKQNVYNAFKEYKNIGRVDKLDVCNSAGFTVNSLLPMLGIIYIPPVEAVKALEFRTFFHPHTSTFIELLNQGGVATVLNADTNLTYDDNGNVFRNVFSPTRNVSLPLPKENIDFSINGAYSQYNWELFFHIPLFIATRLSKNGKYAEAMNWFHYIFDPTTNEAPILGHEAEKYWKVVPFKIGIPKRIQDILLEINVERSDTTENVAIKDWREHPFKPHKIAARRPSAYMIKVVLQYVDNLIVWGDELFRKDTIETINEATQLYVIAGHILGRKPEFVPKRGDVVAKTYHDLRNTLDDFSNAMVEMENLIPYSSSFSTDGTEGSGSILGIGESFYFCIPGNEKLLQSWDTVADRLFKIRHCQNIEGTFRKLALFEPPIDPAMLIRAAAAGLSIDDILTGNTVSSYRYQYLLQKANELCNEVKGLGATMLNAIEKKEGEVLSRLRATQENNLLQMITQIKERQILDAKVQLESVAKNRETAVKRRTHYLGLLGIDETEVSAVELLSEDIDANTSISETNITDIQPDVDVRLVDGGERGVKLIPKEKEDLEKAESAHIAQTTSASLEALAGILHLIPEFGVMGAPFGVGAKVLWGGQHIGAATSALAKVAGIVSSQFAYEANRASKMGSFVRRDQDWVMQANMASREIIQLDKQQISSQIRVQIAQKELANHLKQIENAQETEAFLYSKFTNEELYQWQKEQLQLLYRQSYNIAFDLALKAEASYNYELGTAPSNIIQPAYWDNQYHGLLSGEKLQFALRQLDKAYMEANSKREFEIIKHISISLLDPLALIQLRNTGTCNFEIPEVLFDMDFPGQYFRRIKSVSISIPCISGPYTSISAKLIHKSSSYRTLGTSDSSFRAFSEANFEQSISISSAQNDSGVFELNFRDEKYMPFERLGAVSSWRLELPTEVEQFDYNTIADVILHIKYTAREGGDTLKNAANASIRTKLNEIKQAITDDVGLHFAINLKHDMPNEWLLLKTTRSVKLKIHKSRLPYFVQAIAISIENVHFVAKVKDLDGNFIINVMEVDARDVALTSNLNLKIGKHTGIILDAEFALSIPANQDISKLEELMLVVKYRV